MSPVKYRPHMTHNKVRYLKANKRKMNKSSLSYCMCVRSCVCMCFVCLMVSDASTLVGH